MRKIHRFTHFWISHPALFYGISFFLGISTFLCHISYTLIPCLSLWLPFIFSRFNFFFKPLILNMFVFSVGVIYSFCCYSFPTLPEEGISGYGLIEINQIRKIHSFFGEQWYYEGRLKQFFPTDSTLSIAQHTPFHIIFSSKQRVPNANQNYWIEGKLSQTERKNYILRTSLKNEWIPEKHSFSWAEQRYQLKKAISEWIKSKFSDASSANFLSGLATGEFDDQLLKREFGRFGLQHLLAISGFHFAIVAAFLQFGFRFFFPHQLQKICLLLLLSAYCGFLGPQGSVLRAWMMCSLSIVGSLLKKQTSSLNGLGFALLVVSAYNPLFVQEIGFQLSFSITAAILLFFPLMEQILDCVFVKRSLSDVLEMNTRNQHGYCLLVFIKKGFALTMAVNIVGVPLTLYYFQQFPLMSLIYNLFFPLLTSISICLLLLGILFSIVPIMGDAIHAINNCFTRCLLRFTYNIPQDIDYYLRTDGLESYIVIGFLCLIFFCGIVWNEKLEET